jgi:hypothetical protein
MPASTMAQDKAASKLTQYRDTKTDSLGRRLGEQFQFMGGHGGD